MSHQQGWSLGWRIAKARRDARLLQAELADKVGVDRTLVSKWERDKRIPKLHELAKIAVVTGTDFVWLAEPYAGINSVADVPVHKSSCTAQVRAIWPPSERRKLARPVVEILMSNGSPALLAKAS